MQSRATRAITKAVVAAGTAGAIATACWLLNRILDGSDHKCIEDPPHISKTRKPTATMNVMETTATRPAVCPDDSFSLLPVVSESDDESENAMGYTGDYFTPHYDVCMLSVSIQTVVDPLPDVPSSECRFCRAAEATEDYDAARNDFDLGVKHRALSFSETECSSNRSAVSIASELGDDEEVEDPVRMRSRTEQWLYVRL
ncbi:hypothetical protein GQ600_23145 [Phytophthora cactorum]|nr:hypothetical protein GQ600_23145 [Phytophthora cactorum]